MITFLIGTNFGGGINFVITVLKSIVALTALSIPIRALPAVLSMPLACTSTTPAAIIHAGERSFIINPYAAGVAGGAAGAGGAEAADVAADTAEARLAALAAAI